jgi:hypothetical protein
MPTRRAAALGGFAGVVLMLALSLGSASPSAAQPAAPEDLCHGITCWSLTLSVTGNGSGSAFTTNSVGGPANGVINCVISEGVIVDASCTAKYSDLGGDSLTVHYTTSSQTGTTWCSLNTCSTTDSYWTLTLSSNTQVDVSMRAPARADRDYPITARTF